MDDIQVLIPVTVMPRRRFMATIPLLLATPVFSGLVGGDQEKEPPKSIPELFTPEECERIKASALAMDLENFYGKGYSCAESMLMVALRKLKQPESLVWCAAGFGGGLGQKDLCGYLTAGVMAIGLAAGQLKLERKEAKTRCSDWTKQYWTWWTGSFPLRCAEIRTPEADRDTCRRLGLRAAVRLDELLTQMIPPVG